MGLENKIFRKNISVKVTVSQGIVGPSDLYLFGCDCLFMDQNIYPTVDWRFCSAIVVIRLARQNTISN
jgi:hypothetical protein